MTEHNMKNYEDAYASFSWERPEKYNFARDVIDHWASQDANKLAMIWIDDNGNELKRTFSDISSASKKLSNAR